MKHHIKSILFFITFTISFSVLKAQSRWKMQTVVLESRWAKDVNPEHPHNVYPRPQLERKNWTNLNGLWNFAITEKNGQRPSKFSKSILVPYPIESALSGVQEPLLPSQNLWYNRTFKKPSLKNGDRVLLHFGAVDWQATVFINDKEAGKHTGGYNSFTLDITDHLKDGTNDLSVKVYDPTDKGIGPHGKQVLNPANIYYTPSSGIWQTVWLETVANNYIQSLKITPDIDQKCLLLEVNSNNHEIQTAFEATVYENGKKISVINGRPFVELRIPIANPRLWSPADPFLYGLRIRLLSENKVTDEVESYFGMRKVEVKKDSLGFDRIFLNNRYVYNLGVLDQGYWPDGLYTAPTDEALKFDIHAIKAMGFNTIRKHIKIESARWYYYADKMGMLVWQDFVNPNQTLPEGAKDAFEKQVQETMKQLHNFPSIITWVLFNERWGAYDQERLASWVKKSDPSRLLNAHSGELLYVNERLRAPSKSPYLGSDMVDVHSYPDPMEIPKLPGKANVIGEFGGIGLPVPGHQWDDLKGWGYIQTKPSELPGRYDIMMKRLKRLEQQGLSASIYTQPFDVEGEENGLLTYDREIIKIPLQQLRHMNKLLNPQINAQSVDKNLVLAHNLDTNDTDDRYLEYLKDFRQGKCDSAFLRRMVLMAIRKRDQSNLTLLSNAYIHSLKSIYSRSNLVFLNRITRSSDGRAFQIFYRNRGKINAILGDRASERCIKKIIKLEEIDPYTNKHNETPDWDAIQSKVTKKYGDLGNEFILGWRMAYNWTVTKNWTEMAKYYKLYFERALKRSDWNINNVTWKIFQHINDPEILEFAAKVAKYNFENYDRTSDAADTYANILYKLGKKYEAIEWQKKAIEMSGNNAIFKDKLVKMKVGEPTWK